MKRPVDQPLRNERYRLARELADRARFMRDNGPIAGADEWNERVLAHAQLLEDLAERLFDGPPQRAAAPVRAGGIA